MSDRKRGSRPLTGGVLGWLAVVVLSVWLVAGYGDDGNDGDDAASDAGGGPEPSRRLIL